MFSQYLIRSLHSWLLALERALLASPCTLGQGKSRSVEVEDGDEEKGEDEKKDRGDRDGKDLILREQKNVKKRRLKID